jgi:O-antigen/teichoic acid export membrane protein
LTIQKERAVRHIAHQTLFYGVVRGAPMAVRLLAFFVGAALLDAPALAALGILHASLDLGKVMTDLGIDTFAIRRFARRPLSYRAFLPTLARLKLVAFLVSATLLLTVFWPRLAVLHDEAGYLIIASAYGATLFYGLTGIVIANAQAQGRVQTLFWRVIGCYGTAALAMSWVLFEGHPLWLCYVALVAAELTLLCLNIAALGDGGRPRLVFPLRASKLVLLSVLPVALTVAIGVMHQRVDFFFAVKYLPSSEVAVYAVIQRTVEPSLFLLAAIAVTVFATMSRRNINGSDLIRLAMIVTPATIIGGAALASITFFLIDLFGFAEIDKYVWVCAIAACAVGLKGACLILTALLQAQTSFWFITTISAVTLIVQVGLLSIFVPLFGLKGAAGAQATSDLFNGLIQFATVLLIARSPVAAPYAKRTAVGLKAFLRPAGKLAFLRQLSDVSSILDVGCGNESPYLTKSNFPKISYTGIDILPLTPRSAKSADYFILSSAESFDSDIADIKSMFDAIICSHNIEHCNNIEKTVSAITGRLKIGGSLYISFPSENTVRFPRRRGTLNYYDDPTHKSVPPNPIWMIKLLKQHNLDVVTLKIGYRPIFYFILGAIQEPISHLMRKVFIGTWDFYGFETVIWARKSSQSEASIRPETASRN